MVTLEYSEHIYFEYFEVYFVAINLSLRLFLAYSQMFEYDQLGNS